MSSNQDQRNNGQGQQATHGGVVVNNGNLVIGGCSHCGCTTWVGGMSITWDAAGNPVRSAPSCGSCGRLASS